MAFLGGNIRHLRKERAWTQAQLAEQLSVNRSLIGAYEDGRAEPKLKTLQFLCHLFKCSLEDLVRKDLSVKKPGPIEDLRDLRILPVAVEASGRELISLIPQKAAAGYTKGYSDAEYIEGLQSISLPLPELQQSGTLRIFQIEGDSMLPVPSGAYIIGEFVENWQQIRNNGCYILLTLNDGIVYKRVENQLMQENRLLLKSDNPEYKSYHLEPEEILEVWHAKGILSFDLPSEHENRDLQQMKMWQMMDEMRAELKSLHRRLDQK